MSVALESKNRINALISAANEATGNTDTDLTSAVNALLEGFGQGSDIDTVKFIDVDITVEDSTTTAVTYTVDNLELVSSVENPSSPFNAFSHDDAYLVCISPKEITGVASGDTTDIYNASACICCGNTNYFKVVGSNAISHGTSGVSTNSNGIYGPIAYCTSIVDGKKMGNLSVSVKHHTAGNYEVVAGIYNIKVYYLTGFDWGHPN